MEERKLTITLQADWKAALRAAGKLAQQTRYQGETLNFQNPAAFFWLFGISRGHAQDVVFSIGRNPVRSCKSI